MKRFQRMPTWMPSVLLGFVGLIGGGYLVFDLDVDNSKKQRFCIFVSDCSDAKTVIHENVTSKDLVRVPLSSAEPLATVDRSKVVDPRYSGANAGNISGHESPWTKLINEKATPVDPIAERSGVRLWQARHTEFARVAFFFCNPALEELAEELRVKTEASGHQALWNDIYEKTDCSMSKDIEVRYFERASKAMAERVADDAGLSRDTVTATAVPVEADYAEHSIEVWLQ